MAKENQGKRNDLPKNSAECFNPIETREAVAKVAGVSHDTIAKVKLIQENADDAATRHQGLQIRLETR